MRTRRINKDNLRNICIIILMAAVAGGILVVNIVRKNSWKNQDLIQYSTHSSGGMRGGSSGTTLSVYGEGDKALLTYSNADWYYQDPTVTEYLINSEALDDIKKAFISEGMYNWGGKKFSNHFVADGESTSYDFIFSEDDLSFSSQIYPASYAAKLSKLDRIIEKYSVDGQKMPGLVIPELSEEQQTTLKDPENGKMKMGVSEYSQNRLRYWISNGTDAEVPLEGIYTITDGLGNVIASNQEKTSYPGISYPGNTSEDSIELENRLVPGNYTLKVDDISCNFEIR